VDNCFKTLKEKQKNAKIQPVSIGTIDYACFHAPFAKMVLKAFTRLVYNDLISNPPFPGE